MEKEFIPYEQALALKELGFDEKCGACYYKKFDNQIGYHKVYRDFNFVQLTVSASTYSQAFRWFREKYDLHPSFTRYKSSSINREPTIFTHLYEIQIIDENADKIFHVGDFNSLEEAELACLKKLIEIVKEK